MGSLGIIATIAATSSCRSTTSQPPLPSSSDPLGVTRLEQAGVAGATSVLQPQVLTTAGAPSTLPNAVSHGTQCPNLVPPPDASSGRSCGPLGCLAFVRAEDALAYLLRETRPHVLAVGEVHAQKNAGLKSSPTERFAALLPIFCGTARHIVIELWTGRNDCGDQRVDTVRKAQQPITEVQAPTNQNDFLELGKVAKSLHIQPHALVPTCDDYQSILAAKDQDIARMLELTATRTAELAEQLLVRDAKGEHRPYVILYGGAMHNDMSPLAGRESFSYGPRLATSTEHNVTELDLILREQVKDTESFRRLAFYPHLRDATVEKHFVLYRLGVRSFTLVYPKQSSLP